MAWCMSALYEYYGSGNTDTHVALIHRCKIIDMLVSTNHALGLAGRVHDGNFGAVRSVTVGATELVFS